MASVEEVEVVLVVTPRVVEVLVVSFRGGRGSNFRGGCTAVVLLVVVVVVGPVPGVFVVVGPLPGVVLVVVVGPVPGVVVVVVVGPVPREVVLVVVGVYDAYPFQDRHLVATGRESCSCSCTYAVCKTPHPSAVTHASP